MTRKALKACRLIIFQLLQQFGGGAADPAVTKERVIVGNSGHRGSAFDCAFNEAHILAITQAVCGYRK